MKIIKYGSMMAAMMAPQKMEFYYNDGYVMAGHSFLRLERGMSEEEKNKMEELIVAMEEIKKKNEEQAAEINELKNFKKSVEDKKKFPQVEVKAREGCPQGHDHIHKFGILRASDLVRRGHQNQDDLKLSRVHKNGWADKNTDLKKFIGWHFAKINGQSVSTVDEFQAAQLSIKAGEEVVFTMEDRSGDEYPGWKKVSTVEYGATAGFLYLLGSYCGHQNKTLPDPPSRVPDSTDVGVAASMAVIPLVLQYIILSLLHQINQSNEGLPEDGPGRLYIVTGFIVFIYDVFTFFMGPSLHCLIAVANINYQHFSQKLIAYSLYIADLGVGVAAFFLGLQYLSKSPSGEELLLNIVALHFILDIDDWIAKINYETSKSFTEVGLIFETFVPKNLATANTFQTANPSGISFFTHAAMAVSACGFMVTPWIPGFIAFISYGVTYEFDTFLNAMIPAWFFGVPLVGVCIFTWFGILIEYESPRGTSI